MIIFCLLISFLNIAFANPNTHLVRSFIDNSTSASSAIGDNGNISFPDRNYSSFTFLYDGQFNFSGGSQLSIGVDAHAINSDQFELNLTEALVKHELSPWLRIYGGRFFNPISEIEYFNDNWGQQPAFIQSISKGSILLNGVGADLFFKNQNIEAGASGLVYQQTTLNSVSGVYENPEVLPFQLSLYARYSESQIRLIYHPIDYSRGAYQEGFSLVSTASLLSLMNQDIHLKLLFEAHSISSRDWLLQSDELLTQIFGGAISFYDRVEVAGYLTNSDASIRGRSSTLSKTRQIEFGTLARVQLAGGFAAQIELRESNDQLSNQIIRMHWQKIF